MHRSLSMAAATAAVVAGMVLSITAAGATTRADILTNRVGFGESVTGDSTAPTTQVTSCADSGAGTLRALLATPGPRYIRWGRNCMTHLTSQLNVPSDTTIDGSNRDVVLTGDQGPYHGVVLDHVSNVILEDLTVTDFGVPANRDKNDPHNGVYVVASHGVWVDHLTIANTGNKELAIQDGSTDITASWNRFVGDQYAAQFFQIGDQADGESIDSAQNVTVHHNLYLGPGYRTPSIAYGTLHQFNDVMENWTAYGVHCERLAQCYLESDVFVSDGTHTVGVKYNPQGNGCNDSGTNCDDRWGSGVVVGADLENGATAKSSKVVPSCASTGGVAPCYPDSGSPPETFTPSYPYSADVAGAALRQKVEAQAGAHVTQAW